VAGAAGVGLSHYFSDFEYVTPALGAIWLGQCEQVMPVTFHSSKQPPRHQMQRTLCSKRKLVQYEHGCFAKLLLRPPAA
jgi:hypothetical protein